MTIEQSTKNAINEKLQDGTIEKLLTDNFEKGVNEAFKSLFSPYGDITKIIQKKIESVMIPYLEGYDYSKYIVKLNDVLIDILKNTTFDNKNVLENFKSLMTSEERQKTINVSELFEKWTKYVSKNVSTDGLEVITDDGVYYQYLDVKFEVEYEDSKSWDHYDYAKLTFECEQDEDMNFTIRMNRWKKTSGKGWDIEYNRSPELKSLRYLNEFEVLIMKLSQSYTELIIDEEYGDDSVRPEAEPEATFS
ncbi:hypothetical protein J2W97_001366 [Paenibacillus jamilae]|nr:hypothetical protein [Paenibacillus jamilae]